MAGLGKFFNSETYSGRANVAKATYGTFALLYLFYRIRRGGKKPDDEEPPPSSSPPAPPVNGCQCCQPCQPCPTYCTPAQQVPAPPQQQIPQPPQEDPMSSLKEDPLFKQQQKKIPNNECEDVDCERAEAIGGKNNK